MRIDQKILGRFRELLDEGASVMQTRAPVTGGFPYPYRHGMVRSESTVRVRRSKSEAVSIPAEVASRAAFFARLHREPSLEHWIKKVIAERIDIEEAAFANAKRDLAAQ